MVGISLDLLSTLSSQLNTHSMAAIFKTFQHQLRVIYSIHIRASELVWLSRKLTLISHLKWSFSTTKLERERETRSKSSFGWLQRLSYIYDYGSPYILQSRLKPEQAKWKKITSHMRSDSRFVYYLYEPLAFANESDSNSFLYSLPHFYVFISFTKK